MLPVYKVQDAGQAKRKLEGPYPGEFLGHAWEPELHATGDREVTQGLNQKQHHLIYKV
jgi:hypothetical protein